MNCARAIKRVTVGTRSNGSCLQIVRHVSGLLNHQNAREHCLNLLKKYDIASYLLSGYVPSRARDAFIALHALNIDIARIGDSTSFEHVALLRMQFWKDSISKALDGQPPQEPVAVLLAHAEEELRTRTRGNYGLKKSWLLRIIKAREQYLGDRSFPNISSLENYAEHTYSTMLYLSLSALPLQSVTADHLASHIGKAVGISAVLRGVPMLAFPSQRTDMQSHHQKAATQGAVILPLDILAKCNVQEEQILRLGHAAPNLKDAVFEIATRANDHLITAREMIQNVKQGKDVGHEYEYEYESESEADYDYGKDHDKISKNNHYQPLREYERAFPLLMTAVHVGSWLDRLQDYDFDIFTPQLRQMYWKLPFSFYWSMMMKRF